MYWQEEYPLMSFVVSAMSSPSASNQTADSSIIGTIEPPRHILAIRDKTRSIVGLAEQIKVEDPEELLFIRRRALAIELCVILYRSESVIALIWRRLPFFSSRIAATLYIQLRLRTETLCREYSPSLLKH